MSPEVVLRVHHWLIESPSGGPTVRGRCRDCGEERLFQAALPAEYSWMDGSYPAIMCPSCGDKKPAGQFRMRSDMRKRVGRCRTCEAAS